MLTNPGATTTPYIVLIVFLVEYLKESVVILKEENFDHKFVFIKLNYASTYFIVIRIEGLQHMI